MYMRGVFFVIFCLVTCAPPVQALKVSRELAGSAGAEGLSSSLRLDLEHLSWCDLKWGLEAAFSPDQPGQIGTRTRWQAQLPLAKHLEFILNHNLDHYTTNEIFRLINKNNFTKESYFAHLKTDQLNLGFLRTVPFKERDKVDAIFMESIFELGPLSLTGLQLRYAGRLESGTAQVLQGSVQLGFLQGLGAMGWQTDSKGDESQGLLWELGAQLPGFTANLAGQKIDPDFLSPLAKTNRYTPDRQGWQIELTALHKDLELSWTMRRHTNSKQSKHYNQLALKLEAQSKNVSLEWRIEPTKAFIIRYALEDTLFQMDAPNSTLRTDFKLGGANFSFRLDAKRGIVRLETKYARIFEWRLIGKYDLWRHRSFHSLLARYSGKSGHIQLEIGEYDRGNMGAGFGNPRSLCISWGWKF